MGVIAQARADLANPLLKIPDKPGPHETRAIKTLDAWLKESDRTIDWPPAVSYAMQGLTLKQRRYAGYIALGWPQVVAYKHVYDVAEDRKLSVVYSEASTTLNQKVLDLVTALKDWIERKWAKDALQVRDWATHRLTDEAEDPANKGSERIAATKTLLQMHGQLVQRSEIIHRDGRDVDRQDELAQAMLACIQSSLPQMSQSTTDNSAPQLECGGDSRILCSRCQCEIRTDSDTMVSDPHPTGTP